MYRICCILSLLIIAGRGSAQELLANAMCNEYPDRGTCEDRGFEVKWYYDRFSHRCREFFYGGCGGNDNRFNSFAECSEQCHFERNGENPIVRCSLPHDPGTCAGDFERWYFDTRTKRCLCTWWSGCGGNANRFYSYDHCMQICGQFSVDREEGATWVVPQSGVAFVERPTPLTQITGNVDVHRNSFFKAAPEQTVKSPRDYANLFSSSASGSGTTVRRNAQHNYMRLSYNTVSGRNLSTMQMYYNQLAERHAQKHGGLRYELIPLERHSDERDHNRPQTHHLRHDGSLNRRGEQVIQIGHHRSANIHRILHEIANRSQQHSSNLRRNGSVAWNAAFAQGHLHENSSLSIQHQHSVTRQRSQPGVSVTQSPPLRPRQLHHTTQHLGDRHEFRPTEVDRRAHYLKQQAERRQAEEYARKMEAYRMQAEQQRRHQEELQARRQQQRREQQLRYARERQRYQHALQVATADRNYAYTTRLYRYASSLYPRGQEHTRGQLTGDQTALTTKQPRQQTTQKAPNPQATARPTVTRNWSWLGQEHANGEATQNQIEAYRMATSPPATHSTVDLRTPEEIRRARKKARKRARFEKLKMLEKLGMLPMTSSTQETTLQTWTTKPTFITQKVDDRSDNYRREGGWQQKWGRVDESGARTSVLTTPVSIRAAASNPLFNIPSGLVRTAEIVGGHNQVIAVLQAANLTAQEKVKPAAVGKQIVTIDDYDDGWGENANEDEEKQIDTSLQEQKPRKHESRLGQHTQPPEIEKSTSNSNVSSAGLYRAKEVKTLHYTESDKSLKSIVFPVDNAAPKVTTEKTTVATTVQPSTAEVSSMADDRTTTEAAITVPLADSITRMTLLATNTRGTEMDRQLQANLPETTSSRDDSTTAAARRLDIESGSEGDEFTTSERPEYDEDDEDDSEEDLFFFKPGFDIKRYESAANKRRTQSAKNRTIDDAFEIRIHRDEVLL